MAVGGAAAARPSAPAGAGPTAGSRRELPLALESIARSLRSGASVRQAIGEAAAARRAGPGRRRPGAGRLQAELATVADQAGHGAGLVEALEALAARRPSPGVRLAVAALCLGVDTGGAQARAVDGVAATMRERLAVEAEVRALSSQARMSALVIGLAPLGFGAFAAATDPRTSEFLLHTPAGLALVSVGLLLDGAGWLWMQRLCRVTGVSRGRAWWRWAWMARRPRRRLAVAARPAAGPGPGPDRPTRPAPTPAPPRGPGRAPRPRPGRHRRGRSRAAPACGRPADPATSRRLGHGRPRRRRRPARPARRRRPPWRLVAWAAPGHAGQRRERRRLAALAADLPDVVDLLVLAVGAGLTVPLAVRSVARRAPGPLGAELARACDEASLGRRLGDALDDLPARAGEAVRPLVAALLASERYGAPLGAGLERLAHEVRADRRRRAEEAARKIPVKLLFPLVSCTLPAFGLLTVAPLIASAVRSLRL